MQALYEFPLNEKVRVYLRVEELLSQLDACRSLTDTAHTNAFFDCLFTLIELLERNDIRIELLRDLERHESQLVKWSQHPGICDSTLQELLQQVVRTVEQLQNSNRIGGDIKDDRFLTAIRSRYSMIGGNCCFDLPQLHHWNHRNHDAKLKDANQWLDAFNLAKIALHLNLKMLREKAHFAKQLAVKGAYSESAENIELVRVLCDSEEDYYPTVSGNKYRYTLRFIQIEQQGQLGDIAFQLACC